MRTELSRISNTIFKTVSKYRLKYPLFGESYDWIMGSKLENARNLMNKNEESMKNLRETAYSLQHTLQQKESEYRTIADSLRDLKKTEPNYMIKVGEEIEIIKQIENLQNNLNNHQETEQNTFQELQRSIRDYHLIDSEYRDRLKRISYSWSIVWIVFSVGIGTLFAYRLRRSFLNDLKLLNNHTINDKYIQTMIENTIENKYVFKEDNNNNNNNNENKDILKHINELEQSNQMITEQLHEMIQYNQIKTNENYVWLTGGVIISIIAHSFLLWINSGSNVKAA